MRKYVLNIDRLYTGATANALVLNQVDEDLPILIRQISGQENETATMWLDRAIGLHSTFNPDTYLQEHDICSFDLIWNWMHRFHAINAYIDYVNELGLESDTPVEEISPITGEETSKFLDWNNQCKELNSEFSAQDEFGWWNNGTRLKNLSDRQLYIFNRYLKWFNVPLINEPPEGSDRFGGLIAQMRNDNPEFDTALNPATMGEILAYVQRDNSQFQPIEEFGWWNSQKNNSMSIFSDMDHNLSVLNDYILAFNLNLQDDFKKRGHDELYLMDDTQKMRPNEDMRTVKSDKIYMHSINGKEELPEGEEDRTPVNSSQMNVLFPFKKTTSKSLYASQLTVQSAVDIDDILESARGITLQGNVSYEKCLQAVAQVGNYMYVMSPNVELEKDVIHVHGNGLTIVNAYYSRPYHFPHSMTLFQPSQEHYNGSNLARVNGITDFITWYKTHSRKTRVSLLDTYGTNVSTLTCFGSGSYGLELATYSPTDLVLSYGTLAPEYIKLNSETYRAIRNGERQNDAYEKGVYVLDNKMSVPIDGFCNVGLMFNMYDTFISGNDRILKMHVPVDKDFNKLYLDFECEANLEHGLLGKMEAVVYVNEDLLMQEILEDGKKLTASVPCHYLLRNTAVDDHDILITVRIHYQVDFGKRNSAKEYRERLKKSGITINNIRIDNGVTKQMNQLTFGSYVNEYGITEDERERRLDLFWWVSQYKRNVSYQTVVESALKNMSSAVIEYPNNYSSGDIYGDMFVTKSVLDPRYDMKLKLDYWDDELSQWTDDWEKTLMLRSEGRDYIGLGQCSNQLWLLYKPMDIAIGYEQEYKDLDDDGQLDPDERVYAMRVNPEPELKYQMVEVVKNINRFESSIKHKSNVFSVVVENSNLAEDKSVDMSDENKDSAEYKLETYKKHLRDSITQFVRNTCESIVPVHTQLFDVQFT